MPTSSGTRQVAAAAAAAAAAGTGVEDWDRAGVSWGGGEEEVEKEEEEGWKESLFPSC